MSNMNRDIKVEITMGEYIDLVSKANQLDDLKKRAIESVRVLMEDSWRNDGTKEMTVILGSGKEFREERLERLYQMVSDDDEVIEELFKKGQRYYQTVQEYFTNNSYGTEYKDMCDIPRFKAKWEALEEEKEQEVKADEAEVAVAVEVVENEQ